MFVLIPDPKVERWLKAPESVCDTELVIKNHSLTPDFSKHYAKWRRMNHHLFYYACLLDIEKMCKPLHS
jgi:hypothetical protein